MGFLGQPYAFDSPAAAAAGVLAHLHTANMKADLDRRAVPVPLASARGRVLAMDVQADRDSPPFDYSAMDGYAVRLADLAAAHGEVQRLPVLSEVRIGCKPPAMAAGSTPGAVRIVTGAAIPPGADAVIRREDVTEHRSGEHVTAITIAGEAALRVQPRANIRNRGENALRGDVIQPRGTILSAASLGALAAVGCAAPRVYPQLRIAMFTTGDELEAPEATPDEYRIRNSNGPALAALLSSCAWLSIASCTHVSDEGGELGETLAQATSDADAVVLTGGVSMGHRDPVRAAVEGLGADIIFHGLPQRPGKPMLGAVLRRARSPNERIPIFGLPGNPVSAMVTCTRIVIPVLAAAAGVLRWPAAPRVSLANDDGRALDLWWHRLVRMDDSGAARLVDARGSGDVIAGGCSDGFVEVPPTSNAAKNDGTDPPLLPYFPWPR